MGEQIKSNKNTFGRTKDEEETSSFWEWDSQGFTLVKQNFAMYNCTYTFLCKQDAQLMIRCIHNIYLHIYYKRKKYVRSGLLHS